jgi:hypothetical protein
MRCAPPTAALTACPSWLPSRWEEVLPALRNMVEAARLVRAELEAADPGVKATAGGPSAAKGDTPVAGAAQNGSCGCHAA